MQNDFDDFGDFKSEKMGDSMLSQENNDQQVEVDENQNVLVEKTEHVVVQDEPEKEKSENE